MAEGVVMNSKYKLPSVELAQEYIDRNIYAKIKQKEKETEKILEQMNELFQTATSWPYRYYIWLQNFRAVDETDVNNLYLNLKHNNNKSYIFTKTDLNGGCEIKLTPRY